MTEKNPRGRPAGSRHPTQEPALSRQRIVTAAVELLDTDGVDGLTMRRLAGCLGAGVMSLYWHVDNKDRVLDLALDAVLEYRHPPHSDDPRDWRQDALHLLEDWRAVMLRHPWSAPLLPRQTLGPNVLGRLELLSNALSRAGVTDADLNAAVWSLWNHVMGATVTRASFELSARKSTDSSHGQRLAHLTADHQAIERTGLLLDDDWDGVFRKGLDFLLDGISSRRS